MSIKNAKSTLVHYFQTVWKEVGLNWDSDNVAEVEGIVDDIVAGVRRETEEKRLGIKCDSCGYVGIYADREMQEVAKEHPEHCTWARQMLGKTNG